MKLAVIKIMFLFCMWILMPKCSRVYSTETSHEGKHLKCMLLPCRNSVREQTKLVVLNFEH